MDRSEIMELRRLFKTYKEESCPVNGFSGGFIDNEGEVKGYFAVNRFHDLGSPVKKRVFTLATKAISNNAVTMSIEESARDLFEKINATKGNNMELAAELCERVSKAIKESGNENTYAVHVLSYTYDPPAKTKDHKRIIDGDSDEIFNFFVCMVSPVTTSKASYGYFSDKEKFGMNPLLKIVDNPAAGFVYPDFTGRTSDFDSVLYFRTEKLDISGPLFGEEAPPLPEKKPVVRKAVMSEEVGTQDTSEKAESYSNENRIPSLNTGSLSMEEVHGRDIAAEHHEKDEEREIARIREQDAKEVRTPSAPTKNPKKVRISGNTNKIVKRMIDGVMCFVVPVSDADITA